MEKDNKSGEGEGNDEKVPTAEEFKKLADQVENLNKGIATSREEAKTAKEVAKAATDAFEAYKKENVAKSVDKDDEISDLDAKEKAKFEKWAKAQGLVTKEDLSQAQQTQLVDDAKAVAKTATDEFLEKHPEYNTDEQWAKLNEEFALYRTPADLVGYRKLLEKIHVSLNGKSNAMGEAKAELKKKNILTLSRGSHGGQGDGEYESAIDDMQKKYPSLSREQIINRLDEVVALYPEKKKKK